jgi:hypothetical protein
MIIKRNRSGYAKVQKYDPEMTTDGYLREQDKIEQRKQMLMKTNLYKSRIIDSVINSSLALQITLYYNFFWTFICFGLQLFSVSFKVWVFLPTNFSMARFFMIFVWVLASYGRLLLGYHANINENV